MLYLHFLSFLCIFVSFHTFSLTYDYLKMFCLVSKCFDCFPIFLLLLYIFDSILLWSKNTICIMSRFVLWPRTWSYLVICCMDTWKECEFCCLGVEYSINTNYILFLMVVLFFFFSVSLWIFCLACCWERNVEVFIYNCEFVYFFFKFYHVFASHFYSYFCIHRHGVSW